MSTIRIELGGRGFDVTCADGEEDHVRGLARRIDSRLSEAGLGHGSAAESRTLLFAALLLADDLHERDQRAGQAQAPATSAAPEPPAGAHNGADALAEIIETLAERVESLGSRLEDRLRRA